MASHHSAFLHDPSSLLLRFARVWAIRAAGRTGCFARHAKPASLGTARSLGCRVAGVVAHDFGGATALRTHLLGGKDFRTLTLIDPVALSPWGSPFVRHVRQHEAAFSGLPDYIHQAIVPAYVRGAVRRTMPDEELHPYVRPWLGTTGQAAFYRQIAQMDQRYTDEVAPLYSRVRCPSLVLWGEDDQWIPAARGLELQQAIPGATLQVVPRAGHLVQEDAPEAVVAALLGFLSNERT
ncbi:alpha/beta fold hydrolase [Pandoraea thiooxydans]|uniref:alpha/beta fold hydrolase n=1 Tax=Pandoraea thiooxydans TaxID=445709 RepID=UPI001F271AA0|nr:alpha/beta hydrolase [Pandoraea thiooxydans]